MTCKSLRTYEGTKEPRKCGMRNAEFPTRAYEGTTLDRVHSYMRTLVRSSSRMPNVQGPRSGVPVHLRKRRTCPPSGRMLVEGPENLGLEGIEILKPSRRHGEYQRIVDPPIFMHQDISKPFHRP